MRDGGPVVLPYLAAPALPGMRTRSVRLAPRATSARDGRVWVRDTLLDWALPSYVDTAMLLASELVTNVVLHTATPLSLRLAALGDWVLLVVADGSPALPGAGPAGTDLTTTGRGLLLLERLSLECGVERTGQGKQVWAVLRPGDGVP